MHTIYQREQNKKTKKFLHYVIGRNVLAKKLIINPTFKTCISFSFFTRFLWFLEHKCRGTCSARWNLQNWKKIQNKKVIELCNWIKCWGKTDHKPHFPYIYICISFSFLIEFIWFLEHRWRRRFCDGRNLQKWKKKKKKKLLRSVFENTQNEQHKNSHAAGIGEYITIACKDAPLCLLLSFTPCSYTLPILHNIVRITHPTDARIQNFWLTKE